jgi:hypothetical protein
VEADHWESDHGYYTPSIPNCHDYDHITDPTEYNHHANCEYDADNTNQEVNEVYQPQWSKYEGDGVNGELIHGNNRTGGGQEIEDGREVKKAGHKLQELRELTHYKDKVCKAWEVVLVLNEWEHRHHNPKYHSDDMPGTTRGEYKRGGSDVDVDAYAPTPAHTHLPSSSLPSAYRDYTPPYTPPSLSPSPSRLSPSYMTSPTQMNDVM